MDTIAVKPSTIRIRERCDELTRTAVLEDGCAQWVGAEVRGNDERWEVVHAPIDASLYSGTAGIAAVLSRVDADRYGELARWAARQAVADWHRLPADGAFAGRAGAALAVSRVACASATPNWSRRAWRPWSSWRRVRTCRSPATSSPVLPARCWH